jgi:asparagine synthase (glutamine-hydrolysing)
LVAADSRPSVLHALDDLVAAHQMTARPSLEELQCVDAREYLPNDILVKVDRMTMAHSLESRAPLLHPRVAGLALASTARFEGSPFALPKRLLREIARERLGARVANAKKQGFSIPIHAWLRNHARDLVEDLLSRESVARLELLDVAAVSDVRRRFLEGSEPLGFEVWGLMVLVAWHRARVVSSARISGAPALERIYVP